MTFWVAGAAVVGGGLSYLSSQNAADAQKSAAKDNKQLAQQTLNQQNALAQQQLEISRPYVQSGQQALNAINSFLGLPSVRGSNFNGVGGAGAMGGNPNLVKLSGITTNGVHSQQTNTDHNPLNPVNNLGMGMLSKTVGGGSAPGNADVYYDRYNDAIVDGNGNILHANASTMSGDLAGLVAGYNNGVQINNGTLFGVGSKGAGSLNLNLKPLTAAEKAAFDRGSGGQSGSDYATNINNILNLPGFAYTRQAGNDVINKNLAAQGKFFSGQRGAALVNYNNNLTANQLRDMYLNPLMTVAGYGPQGASTASNALSNQQNNLTNYSGNVMGANNAAANARASGYIDSANGVIGALGTGYQAYQNQQQQQNLNNLLAQYGTRSTPANATIQPVNGGGTWNTSPWFARSTNYI